MEITQKLHYFLHFQYTNSIYLNSPFHIINIYSFLVVQSLMYLKKVDNRVKYEKKLGTFLVITRAIIKSKLWNRQILESKSQILY